MSDTSHIPPQTEQKGEPDSPLDLPAEGWKASLKRSLKQFKEDRGTLVSAGMAFYWFLAVFPALLAAVGITGLIGLSQQTVDAIGDAIKSTLPLDAARVLTGALDQASDRPGGASVIATVIGAAVALWSASAGMVALQTGLNIVYEVPEDRPYVKKRLRALLLMAVTVVLAGIATASIVFGQPIGDAINDHLPLGGTAFVVLWTLVRWVVGFAALTALFAAYYFLAPNREEPKWTWLTPGGAVATAIWLIASLGFSFYVSSLGSYGETYGSLTGVVVLLLWLFLSGIAVVLGGEINSELERQAERQRRGGGGRHGRQRARARGPETTPAPAAAPSAPNGDDRFEREWQERMRQVWQPQR